MADISKDTLNKETNALFWAQTSYKVGQKLDPSNLADKAYLPIWMDIYHKVKRAAEAGTLVTTYDHPVVAQHLSDAAVASKAAAAHLDAAVATSDPVATQDNVLAATTATQISAQKAREAAANQPPVVSPASLQEAGKTAVKSPPPPSAPSEDHIAHGHARGHAHGHHKPVQEQALPPTGPSHEVIYKETNARFWRQTHYKIGKKLDQSNPQDREMAKIWMAILRQVQHEAAAGTLVFTSPELRTPPTLSRPPMVPPYPQMPQIPPMAQPYPQMPPMAQPYPQMPPMAQPYPQPYQTYQPAYPQRPNGHARGSRHRHGHGQHPQMGPQPGGQTPPMAVSAPQGVPGTVPQGEPSPGSSSPGSEGFTPSEGSSSESMPGGAPSTDTAPPETTSLGTYLAIGLAVIAGGGLLYYATSHKSPGRAPKVLLTTPARSTSLSTFPRP
jgi:hypothetical protein